MGGQITRWPAFCLERRQRVVTTDELREFFGVGIRLSHELTHFGRDGVEAGTDRLITGLQAFDPSCVANEFGFGWGGAEGSGELDSVFAFVLNRCHKKDGG